MRLRTKLITSFLTIAVLLSSFSLVAAFDEGMYTPDQIAKLPLKQKGLKINPLDIYNPNGGADISDAVISLSIGCTAEFVSPQGLILTNHHCGFDALVAASSAGKDYGKDGYKADSMQNELPAKDYSLTITNRIEDVTAKIKKGTENLSGEALAQALKANTDKLQAEEKAKVPADTNIRISMLNNGYFYYLYET
ncbi:MAG TPA: S46 family peptidase, partial [Pyrinomonadaceae bacterium]|nr:S46 family peptidase [Pyrinomonadaceae bacterium]